MSNASAKTGRGEASERLLTSLVSESPTLHSRRAILESGSLLARLGKKKGQGLTEREHNAAAKTLGRLIEEAVVREVLLLSGGHPKVDLPEAGLVAVSVSLTSLKRARDEYDDKARKEKHARDSSPEPSQENIVEEIVEKSRRWIEAKKNETQHGLAPISLVNVSIVHGSGAFDILITVLYRNSSIFMRYIRDVVQRVEHIEGTHTMQIASNRGFLTI